MKEKPAAIAFYGNIVDLLEYAAKAKIKIDLLSDQTSCHNVYEGGYCPVGITFEERTRLLQTNPETFRQKVDASLARHYQAIKSLVEKGTYFFDYGNSFMKAVFDSGIKEICKNSEKILWKVSFGQVMWKILWGRSCLTTVTDLSAGSY